MNESTYKLIINDVKTHVKDEKFQKVIIENLDLLLKEIATKHEKQCDVLRSQYYHLENKFNTIIDIIEDLDDDVKFDIIINTIKEL